MRQSFCRLTFLVTLAMFVGCSLVQPADSKIQPEPPTQMSMDELREIESVVFRGDPMVPTLDPKQLQVAQHVQIMTGIPSEDFQQEIEALTSRIAGTVKEITADHVVLQDVVMISQKQTQRAVPVVGKVPYFNQFFKNTAIGRELTPVPGDVTIELSKILHAKELTDSGFAEVRESGVERIGVDFDFNGEDGGRPMWNQH